MDERRKLERREIMFYSRVFDRKTGKHLGYLGNLTTGGLMIISEEAIDDQVSFELRVELPEDTYRKNVLDIAATSLWCQPDIDPKLFNIGFELGRTDPEDLDIIEELVKDFKLRN